MLLLLIRKPALVSRAQAVLLQSKLRVWLSRRVPVLRPRPTSIFDFEGLCGKETSLRSYQYTVFREQAGKANTTAEAGMGTVALIKGLGPPAGAHSAQAALRGTDGYNIMNEARRQESRPNAVSTAETRNHYQPAHLMRARCSSSSSRLHCRQHCCHLGSQLINRGSQLRHSRRSICRCGQRGLSLLQRCSRVCEAHGRLAESAAAENAHDSAWAAQERLALADGARSSSDASSTSSCSTVAGG